MFTGQTRVDELRERFCVHNGQFWGEYRFKNLNWYYKSDLDGGIPTINREDPGEWFCYGDVRDEDIERLTKILNQGECLILGWKDLGPDTRHDDVLREGGGIWLVLNDGGVIYDVRRDGRIMEPSS